MMHGNTKIKKATGTLSNHHQELKTIYTATGTLSNHHQGLKTVCTASGTLSNFHKVPDDVYAGLSS